MNKLRCLVLLSLCASQPLFSVAAPRKLSWVPPTLKNPVTKSIGPARSSIKLDTTKDYILKLPANQPYVGELNIYGGSNVVIIGGTVRIPSTNEGYTASRRGVYLHGQTGTIHVEGLHITGNGLNEGFNFDERNPNCIVQLQNIRCDFMTGSYSANHADMIQSWAGPNVLRIDRFTGYSQYQGFFMLPNQHFAIADGAFVPKDWDFRYLNLMGDKDKSAYMLWTQEGDTQPAVTLHEVYARPKTSNLGNRNQYLWPKNDVVWSDVVEGTPAGGDFVPESVPGYGYKSPGYRATTVAAWAAEFGGGNAFAKRLPITVKSSAAAAQSGFPVLVRLSTAISGFRYSDFKNADGSDLLFVTESGTVLPYEIDTWNPAGESLVWVRLPSAKSGSVFYACYGNSRVDYPAPKTEVWSDHAGVWHLGEDFAAKAAQNQKRAYDSTGNGLDAYGRDPTEGNVYLAEMLPTAGRLAGGRRNQTSASKPGVYSSVESYDRLKLGGSFTFSGWYKAASVSGYPRPVSRKNNYSDNSGWEVQVDNGSAYEMSARGSGSTAVKIKYPKAFDSGWHHYAWVYDGTKLSAYQDGALVTSGTIVAAKDNGLPLSFGSNASGTEQSWSGDYDELRLRRGAASAAAVAAEYATMTDAGFLAFGSVGNNGDTPVVEDPGVRYVSTSGDDSNDGFTADRPLRSLDRAVSSLDAVGGGHVYVAAGTYEETSRHVTVSSLNTYSTTKEDTCVVITNAITVTGLGIDPSKTVVTKKSSPFYARIFYLNHAGAKLENLTVKDGKIEGDGGKGSDGGNIWIGSAGGWVDNCVVSGGTASWTFGMSGGNVYMAGGRVSRSKITGGTVTSKTGQAHNGSGVSMTGGILENSLVSGNTGTTGAAVWAKGSAKVVNCTVVGNACRTPSGVHAEGNATVVNTVIFGNTAENGAAAADASGSFDACAADFTINQDCQLISAAAFTDSASGDYTAAEGSSLIDAGVDYSSTGAASGLDLAGETRVKGKGVDAGCYESDHAAVVSRIRYVATTGDDSASGTAADRPLRTIAAAIRSLDRLGGGEIRLAAGVYEPATAFETVTWSDHGDVTSTNTCLVVTNAITIVGDVANPASVVIRRPAQVGGVDFYARVFYVNHAEAKIAGVTIANGRPPACNGGNVYIGAAGGTLEDCIIENGDATRNWGMSGGNVFMRAGRVTRCVIRGGKSKDGSGQWAWGGGVAMGGGVLDSCLVVSNTCARGASVWAKNDAKVVNCTVVGNTGKNISGVHAESGCSVVNCAIFGNVSSGDTTGTAHVWHSVSGVFSHCAAEIAINESCLAVADALFTDAAKGDYRPAFGSRLIDAGGDVTLSPAASTTDLARAKRVSGPAVDIGCYEYQQGGAVELRFSADRQEAVVGERIAFTAQYAGISGGYSCAWDFDGDGHADATIADDAAATWSYPAPGVYTVSLAITAAGKSTSFSRQAYIRVATATERWLAAVGGLDGFEKRVKFSLTAASTGVPIPVVLSPAIYGFSYDDFATFGNDLVFTDADGALVPHEVESWHVGGKSVVWVKLPPAPAGTVFYAYYSNPDAANPPPASDFRDAVWEGYAGVWHMGEEFDAGVPAAEKTAFDSTGNGFDAVASGTTNLEQMEAYAQGAVGPARELQHVNSKPGAYLSVTNGAAYDALKLGGSFTFSGWFRANAVSGNPRPVSRKNSYNDGNGWEVQSGKGSKTVMGVRGAGGTLGSIEYPSSFTSGWNHFTWVFDGTKLVSYQNGVAVSTNTIEAATDNGKPLSFGNNSNGTEQNWNGQLDELRLAKRPLTAEEVAAEYASMSDGFSGLVLAHAATDVGADGYTWTGGLIDVPAGQTLVIEHLDIELPVGAADVVCGKTGGGTLVLCGDEVFDWTNRFFYVESGEVVLANTSGTPVVGALRMSGGKVTFGAPNQVMLENEKHAAHEGATWYLGGNATVDLAGYEQKVLHIHVGDYAWNGRPSAPWTGSLLGTGMLRLGVSNSGDDRYAGMLFVHPEIAAPVVFADGITTHNGRYGQHTVSVADVPGIDTELVFDGSYFNGRTGNNGANVVIDGYGDGEEKTYGAVAFNAPTTWGSRGTLSIYATVYANAQEGSSIGLLTNVTVETTGVLGGDGRVRTMGAFVPVVVKGRLAPGNPDDPAGRLVFGETGAPTNVELADGAAMSVSLARDENGDRLSSVAIEGALKIGENVSFAVAAGRLSETRRFRVIEATGGIEGSFASASLDIDEYVARLEYGETEGVSWVDVVIEEAQPVFYDPSGAEVVDTGVYAWLIAQNAVQAQISALTQQQFDEAYLLNLALTSVPASGPLGRLAITSIDARTDEVTVTVLLDRSAAGVAAKTTRAIIGRLRLSGTGELSDDFSELATAEIADDDFSSGNETSVVFPIPAKDAPRFFRAEIVQPEP